MAKVGLQSWREPRGHLDQPGMGGCYHPCAVTINGWVDAMELSGCDQVELEVFVAGQPLPKHVTTLRDRPDVRQSLGLPDQARNGFHVVADFGDLHGGAKLCGLAVQIVLHGKVLFRMEGQVELFADNMKKEGKPVPDYDQDGLATVHNNEFMLDPRFRAAYARGVKAAGQDYHFQWRVHMALWAAQHASVLPGDFVECGVNAGFVSSAIMHYLDWDSLKKTFYLLDSFSGLDLRQVSKNEIEIGVLERNKRDLDRGFYVRDVELVRENFKSWKHHRIIQGIIPDTLVQVDSDAIAFLHLDLNCAQPEVAALEYFWNRLTVGAIVLLDDYAYVGFRMQKLAMDHFAEQHRVAIASLPTGQGMLIRPPR